MGVTTSEAIAAVRARLTAGSFSFPLYYDGDPPAVLPDEPSTFGFVEFRNQGSVVAAYGGGRGANVYRNSAMVYVFVFSPIGSGLEASTAAAEPVAAQLRSYRNNVISCFNSDVIDLITGSQMTTPGLRSDVNNYMCAIVECALIYDQIG